LSNTDGLNGIEEKNVVVETEKNVLLSNGQENSRYLDGRRSKTRQEAKGNYLKYKTHFHFRPKQKV
jgi:hypothetical protein